jgi:alpha-tubulin suppressor-like RCC1 family protein
VDSAGAHNQTGWEPERVLLPAGVVAVAISCGDSHSVALASDGKVYAWGTFRDKSGVMGARTESSNRACVPPRCL